MLTPMTLDPNYSPLSSFQNFCTLLHDASENYLFGYRGEDENKQKGWMLTALRISSFFTVVLPFTAYVTWTFTPLLMKKDDAAEDAWKEKIFTTRKANYYDVNGLIEVEEEYVWSSGEKRFLKALARSGIQAPDFDKIFIIEYKPGSACRSLAADGSFPHLIQLDEIGQLDEKILVITYGNVSKLNKFKEGLLANEDELKDRNVRLLTLSNKDIGLGFTFSRIFLSQRHLPSNRLKEVLLTPFPNEEQ